MSVWEEKCIISPSLICLDMCNLESQIRILEQSGSSASCRHSGRPFQSKHAFRAGYSKAAASENGYVF